MRVLAVFEKEAESMTARHWWKLVPKIEPLCESFKRLTLADLAPGYTAKDLYADYKPDVLLFYGLLNPDRYFAGMPCAKAAVVTDFCYTAADKGKMRRYTDNRFDLMFQRGTYDPKVDYGLPQIWWPFSADPEEFFPGSVRINKIGFAGSLNNHVYDQRKIVLQRLAQGGIPAQVADIHYTGWKGYDPAGSYPTFLRSFVSCLTSTQMDGVPPEKPGNPKPMDMPPTPRAKTFEIMASETALLTPPFLMRDAVLGKSGEAYFEYEYDCSDVAEVARGILVDKARTREVARKGYELFLERHTDEIRIRELYGHLERLVGGRPIERKWGI